MAIRWNPDQRQAVAVALLRFPWTGVRCAAAARAILPIARQRDISARGLRITGPDEARFIISKSPKKRYFDHHVLVETEQHRVDAFTGEDGWNAGTYLEKHWEFHDLLRVDEVDVHTIDPGIQQDGEQ